MLIDETFTIGEIAEIFKVPSSTIRYWEEKKLITSKRNQENDYRIFDFQTILDLSDIIFYRDLNVPVKQMVHFHQNPPEKLLDMLTETELNTLQQLEELKRKTIGIRKRKEQLNELLFLKEQDFTEEVPTVEKIISFDLSDSDELQVYLENPGASAMYYHPEKNPEVYYGLCVEEEHFSNKETLWENHGTGTYLKFLLMIQSDNAAHTNLVEKEQALLKQGLRTGQVLGRYLATAINEAGFQMDYYKAWIEIIPTK